MAEKDQKLPGGLFVSAPAKSGGGKKRKPSVRPSVENVTVRPTYGLVFDPTGQQSEILSAEQQAARDLYLRRVGQAAVKGQSARDALESAGFLNPAAMRTKQKRTIGENPIYASAADALDAIDKAAGKGLAEGLLGPGTVGLYKLSGLAAKPIEEGVSAYKQAVIERRPELAREKPKGSPADLLGAYRRAVIEKNPELAREKPSDINVGGLISSAVGNIPSPIPSLGGLRISATPTGQLYTPAPKQPATLGGLQDVAKDIAAKPNQYIDASAKNKQIIAGASSPVVVGIGLALDGVSGPEIQTAMEQSKFDGLSPNEDAQLKLRAQREGHDVANWSSLLPGEKVAMAYTSSNYALVTMRNAFRAIGATGATPAGVKAIGDAAFSALRGDTEEGRVLIEGLIQPYAYANEVAKRDGLAAGLAVFVRDNPVDAALAFNTALRTAGRVAGIAARTGIVGDIAGRAPGVVGRAARGAEEFARVGRPVSIFGGTVTVLREVPLVPEPFRFEPGRGTVTEQYIRWQERTRAQQGQNAQAIAEAQAAGRVSEAGVPYAIERVPEERRVTIGYTTPNITSGISLAIKSRLASKSGRYAKRLLEGYGIKYTRTQANIADGVAVEIERTLTEALGRAPTDTEKLRAAFDLSRYREMFGGEEYTPLSEANFRRSQIDELKASPEYIKDPERPAYKQQIARWEKAIADLEELDKVKIEPAVTARIREKAKPIGEENTRIIAAAMGVSVDEAKRADAIRLLVIDPRFEQAARALKQEKNVGLASPKALIKSQRRIAALSAKMRKRVTTAGYGKKSAPKSRRLFEALRSEMVAELRKAERLALEQGDEALANQYRDIRAQFALARASAPERAAALADQVAAVGRLEANVAELPAAARQPYVSAYDAMRAEREAEIASMEATAAQRAAESAAGVRRVDDRMIALAEQAAERARQESESLAGFRGELIPGRVEDMGNRRWVEITDATRSMYSDSRPGWVSVEYVRAGDLRGMSGNLVDDAKVQALRGQEYNNPIILDYDPDTGFGYISEGNHRLAAATDDQWVPVQVMRSRISSDKQLRILSQSGDAPKSITKPGVIVDETGYVPSYIYPHEVGFDIRAVSPEISAARSKAASAVASTTERLAALREAEVATAASMEARGALRKAIGRRESAVRQAQDIIKRNAPVLDTEQVRVAIDKSGDLAAVRVRQRGEYGYYNLERARGEVVDQFIARAEANDVHAVLHLVQKGPFISVGDMPVISGTKIIETGPGGRIRKGRLKSSKGQLFYLGGEDFSQMWRNLMFDTAEVQSAIGWQKKMQQLIEAVSIKVSVSEQIMRAAQRDAERMVREDPTLVYDDVLRRNVLEALRADSFEFDIGDFELINPVSPKARMPRKAVPAGSVTDEDTIASFMMREINERTIDPKAPGDYFLVPRALYDGIQQSLKDEAFRFRPGNRKISGYNLDRLMRAWRTLTLNVLPKTAFANMTGSAILALQAGAGPRSWYMAWRALTGRVDPRTGRAYPIPQELLQRYYDQFTPEVGKSGKFLGKDLSEASTAMQVGAAWVAWWMNNMRRLNGMSEDLGRLAVWYSKSVPEALAREERGAGSIMARARRLNDDAMDLLESMARNDAEWAGKNAAWLQQSYDFLGYLHRGGAGASWLRIAVPFWQWYAHMLKLTFVTMPIKYPGRALFLQQLGEIGDEYQRTHGVIIPWGGDIIPIWSFTTPVENQPQFVTTGIGSSSWYPQGTVANIADREGTLNIAGYVRGSINPQITNSFLIALSLGAAFGKSSAFEYSDYTGLKAAKNEYGNEIDSLGMDYVNYIANRVGQMMPLAPTVMSLAGRPANSTLWNLGERAQKGPSIPSRRTDIVSVVDDPWGPNPLMFLLKAATGMQFVDVPGLGPVERERVRKTAEYEARNAAREERNIADKIFQIQQAGNVNPQPISPARAGGTEQ